MAFTSTDQASDGFFSQIATGIGTAIGQTASLVPIWASKQLGLQQQNQLANNGVTFIPVGAVNPVTPAAANVSGSFSTGTLVAVVAVAGVLLLVGLRA